MELWIHETCDGKEVATLVCSVIDGEPVFPAEKADGCFDERFIPLADVKKDYAT